MQQFELPKEIAHKPPEKLIKPSIPAIVSYNVNSNSSKATLSKQEFKE